MALEILNVILLSMLPISELRGAIPYGIAVSHLNPTAVFVAAVVSNMLAVPIVYLFLDYAHSHLMSIGLYRSLFSRYVERAKKNAGKYVSKYGYLGLVLFVAVPLPATGAYTGTLGAWLLGMERKKSAIAIFIGVIIAGTIVTVLSLTGAGVGAFISNKLSN